MSRTSKVLLTLAIMAFLAAMFAVAIGEVVPHPDELAKKLSQTVDSRQNFDTDLKLNPKQAAGLPAFNPEDEVLFEGFEAGVPPTNWTTVVNNPYTWETGDYAPYEGLYYATCLYDETYTGDQDEWLITPALDFSTKQDLKLDFWWNGSYYWGVDPYDNCDLTVKVSTNGTDWTDLWNEDALGVFDNWVWYNTVVDLTAYAGEATVYIAFVYTGYDGAQYSVDAVSVNDDPLPVGRCCYGDVMAPSCDDVTQIECDALGGDWDAALNCTDNPCPIPEGNDECVGAYDIPGPYPALVEGNTFGATVDCPGVLDWNAVWYKFNAPYTCNNVTMNYCDVPNVQEVLCCGVVVYAQCDDCPNYILHTETEWVDCPPAPTSQPISHFNLLPGPATYYYPVFMGDADCNNIEAEFAFTLDIQECPPPETGDWCDDPIVIELPAALDYLDAGNYTCGRTNYYNETCLSYYDGGEDIIYQLDVTSAVDIDIALDPLGTTYTGILLDDACPADPMTCIATATNSGSSAYSIMNQHLEPGTYYIMIDTWPLPDCIPAFDLSITTAAGPTSGDDCTDPIMVKIPADLPYADLGQYNCGRGNAYDATCLGYYDGGEDIIYQVDVTDASVITITMDPKGTTYSGLVIDDACPPDPSDCLATVTGSSSDPKIIEDIALAAGVYYIMVDTWPSPNCIPDFDLTIDPGADPPEIDVDETLIDFSGNFSGDFGDEVLTIANTGGADLTFDASVTYAKLKEIDGAYVAAVDEYLPGGTMDVVFQLTNDSQDAEWLDEATITFPAGITVNSGTNFVVPSNDHYLAYDGTTGAGATVTWFDDNEGYGNIYSTETAYATMNLTFDAGLSGPITCDFTISGDDYGSDPHDVAGTFDISESDPYTSWLEVAPVSGVVEGGMSVDLDVSWNSTGMVAGTYDATIVIDHNASKGQALIPVQLVVEDGVVCAFDPSPAYMYYMFAFTPIIATVNVDTPGTITNATVNGVPATVVGPGQLEVPIAGVLEGYGAPIGTVAKTFAVAGDYDDATTFTGGGVITVIGKNPANPRMWILPQDEVVLHGDADASGEIDIDDAVKLIGFIFAGDMLPGPMLIADCDCSNSSDIDDVVYLIGYIFSGGPFPCHEL